MMKLIIASHNPAKVEDYKYCLSDLPLELLSLKEVGVTEEAPENEETFKENALSKARFYHELTSLPTIADDGGLMIDALNGAPGVKSRRWMGYPMSDEEMIDSVMERMKEVPEGERSCRLVGVIALVLSKDEVYTENAHIEGVVARTPSKERIPGYPYRSFFYLPRLNKFYAEINEREHEMMNHRKKALHKMRSHFFKLL